VKRFRSALLACLAVLAMGAVTASSAAAADGTVSGIIRDSGGLINCRFDAEYNGVNPPPNATPPNPVVIDGSTVVLSEPPPDPPITCDPSSVASISDIGVTFTQVAPGNWQIHLSQFQVVAVVDVFGIDVECEYETDGTIDTDLPGPATASGSAGPPIDGYSGSGSANPTGGFPCSFGGERELIVEDVVFNP
jgi:hypothetical protein